KGSSPRDEWGFMYDDRKDRTFGNAFPEAWQNLTKTETGQFFNPKGLFTFTTIHPFSGNVDIKDAVSEITVNSGIRNYHWKVISHLQTETLNADLWLVVKNFILLDVILTLILAIGAWFFAVARVKHKQTEVALRTSEEQFRGAFDVSATGIVLVETEGHFISVNKAFRDMVGYSETELLAMNFKSITHPDDLESDLEYVRSLLAGKIPSFQMTKRYYHKQG
ncbi:MAG: PAS domain S-box protein, partial [bacterium]|nr:PAS domain S-box protein [bacterium]